MRTPNVRVARPSGATSWIEPVTRPRVRRHVHVAIPFASRAETSLNARRPTDARQTTRAPATGRADARTPSRVATRTRGAPSCTAGVAASGAIAVAYTPSWNCPSNGADAHAKTGTAVPPAANDGER